MSDEDGRLIGHLEERESPWTREEVDLLLASREVENDVGPHGHPMSEALVGDPFDDSKPHYYEAAEVPVVDYAEKARLDAIERYRAEYTVDGQSPNMHGLIFPVSKVERP